MAVHLGGGNWILVDSCVPPRSKYPASLEYLKSLGVDVETQVQLVIVSHWHDDHFRGISTILEECTGAELAISSVIRVDEFRQLAALYSKQPFLKGSGLDEFGRIFSIIEERRQNLTNAQPLNYAIADRILYNDVISLGTGEYPVVMYSLSPSDASVLQAQLSFMELLPNERDQVKKISARGPNHSSVVLWIAVGNERILLGADLENTPFNNTGWTSILETSKVTDGQASVFKIPHHGSANGHNESIWDELLVQDAYAIVTPYNRGRTPIPTHQDVLRITSLTPHAFGTALPLRRQHRFRNRVVREMLAQVTRDVNSAESGWGHVRLRRTLGELDNHWRTELFGHALSLES